MANRKEPKRPKRKRKSPAEAGVAAAQRTLATVLSIADPEAKRKH
jgi:hypothetical protein